MKQNIHINYKAWKKKNTYESLFQTKEKCIITCLYEYNTYKV